MYTIDSDGHLYGIETSRCEIVAEWKPENAAAAGASGHQEPMTFTSLSAAIFSDDVYLITTIASSGCHFFMVVAC